MEKYAVMQFSDGNFLIVSEHGENLDAAIIKWHQTCANLRNDKNTLVYSCSIVNNKWEVVGDYREYADRTPAPTPETTE